jgi:hypothetical protein
MEKLTNFGFCDGENRGDRYIERLQLIEHRGDR